jgi:transmembrane sensor
VQVLHRTRSRLQRDRWSHAGGLAAAAAMVVAAAGILALHESEWLPSGGQSPATRTTRDFAASAGERALIDLSDGTHIVLAPATHLRVSMPAGQTGVRELTLDGEAMFTVTHDAARPFVVHSRYGTTVDVGTSFAVRAYAGEAYRVVVRDGRVALGNGRAPVLVAGDVATRGADGAMHVAHAQDASGLLDWSDGRLAFSHTRVADLVPELERWYGVHITIATPELRERFVTGQFDTESREQAMNALGRALGARHAVDGSHVTFSLPSLAR